MKIVKRILLLLFILVLVACGGPYFYAKYAEPTSEGDITLEDLHENVEVISDPYGIPHIYAKNEEDLFFAMGYMHAQERLFQMELLRRLAMGRLSEILGPDLVETDILFRTLGLDEAAKEAKKIYLSEGNAPYQKAALAYLAGLNKFVDIGATPTEFTLMGIPKTHFTEENFYHILGYMAFGFAMAQREEPILEKIRIQLGPEYLADWVINHREGMQTIPITNGNGNQQVFPEVNPATALHKALEPLPVPLLLGSNSWVIGPAKSASGKPILANDAHIGYSQPATWFEAHLECPDFSLYGHFLAGFPFGVIGHNRDVAWGITMLQNDDMDFYYEKINPENPNQVWFEDKWEEVQIREEALPIKDQKDTVIQVRYTRHGPLISGVFDGINDKNAVSMSWTYLKNPSRNLEATYLLNHAKSMEETRLAASMIEAPGLNLMFADTKGNIAWWAAGRWTKYDESVNSQLFMDGSSGTHEATGLMDFEKNPRAENPDWGFVYSANNQPEKLDSTYLPGQYAPQDRAKRIFELLKGKDKWTVEEVKAMSIDVKNDLMPGFIQEIIPEIKRENGDLSDREKQAMNILKNWDGNHSIVDVGPTIYMKLIFFILKDAIGDELGESDFESVTHTFLLRRTLPILLRDKISPWWDDIHTPDIQETRQMIFSNAFFKAVASLSKQLGEYPAEWTWGKVHTFEVQHPVGRVPPMDKLYNVGPFPAPGGLDVINNIGADFSADGLYRATYGPSKRIVIDMADVENGYCIMPTGNSGHLLNPHYADQTEMYLKGEFRKMMMNRDEIVKTQEGRLELKAKK